MGVDGVEPDIVVSRDGVLVVRHENEISGTTDVADRIEYANRRTTKTIDGAELTGWFTEDFTWDELSTLRCRERLPKLRPSSASFDDEQPVLRLRDVLDLVRAGLARAGPRDRRRARDQARHLLRVDRVGCRGPRRRRAARGRLGSRRAAAHDRGVRVDGARSDCRNAASRRPTSTCSRRPGRPFDLVATLGKAAPTYRQTAAPAGLDALVGVVDGISVDKRMILAPDKLGRTLGPSSLVADAHARGLRVFTWTCRPENSFLIAQFRARGGPAAFGDWEAEWDMIRGCRSRRRLRRSRRSRSRVLPGLIRASAHPSPRQARQSGPWVRRNARCACSQATFSVVAQPITSPRNVTR